MSPQSLLWKMILICRQLVSYSATENDTEEIHRVYFYISGYKMKTNGPKEILQQVDLICYRLPF